MHVPSSSSLYLSVSLSFTNTRACVCVNEVEEGQHLYRKTHKIWAAKVNKALLLESIEGMETANAGDFLAQNPVGGAQWPIEGKHV
jgi:hypothetical protein